VGFNGFKGLQSTPCFLHGVSHESRAVTFPDDDRRSTDDDRRSPRGVIVRKYVPTRAGLTDHTGHRSHGANIMYDRTLLFLQCRDD
jgi:hypothetical protein